MQGHSCNLYLLPLCLVSTAPMLNNCIWLVLVLSHNAEHSSNTNWARARASQHKHVCCVLVQDEHVVIHWFNAESNITSIPRDICTRPPPARWWNPLSKKIQGNIIPLPCQCPPTLLPPLNSQALQGHVGGVSGFSVARKCQTGGTMDSHG